MDIRSIFNLLLIIGVIQGFIFIIATFLLRKKIERPILFLNLFILFLSLNNLQAWTTDKGILQPGGIYNEMLIPWYILIVPMFYAFLIYFLEIERERISFLKWSVLLFLLALGVKAIIIVGVENESLSPIALKSYKLSEDAIVLAYSIFLYIKSIRLLYTYEQLYPNILSYDNLKWIKLFLKLGGLVFLFWITAVCINIFSATLKPPYTYYPLRLSSSILIYWVGYQGFLRYVILKDRIDLRDSIRPEGTLKSKIKRNKLKEPDKADENFDRIHAFLLSNKVYLNPHLSQESLAEELTIGTSTLSKLVNDNFEGNFSDYINNFRVEEAMKILINRDFENYTIVAIALECGFNSKSTFYTAFKKFTGLTPSDFRANAQK